MLENCLRCEQPRTPASRWVRGLCVGCYEYYRKKFVKPGNCSWSVLEKKGRCLPKLDQYALRQQKETTACRTEPPRVVPGSEMPEQTESIS